MRSDFAIDCFDQAGYHGLPNFAIKELLVQELCYFYVIDKARSAIEKFKDGLRTLDVLDLLMRVPSLFHPYFCYGPTALTAGDIDSIFIPKFSEEGCRIREREELIIMHWRDYLQDCEGTSRVRNLKKKLKSFFLIHFIILLLELAKESSD